MVGRLAVEAAMIALFFSRQAAVWRIGVPGGLPGGFTLPVVVGLLKFRQLQLDRQLVVS